MDAEDVEFLDLTTRVVQMAKCVEGVTLPSVFICHFTATVLRFLPGDS